MTVGMFEVLCACVVILCLIYYYLTIDFDYWTSRGIIGPKPIPFFGNIAEFILGKKCLGDIYKDIYDRYPKEAMVGVFVRGSPVLVLRDPEYIKQVLIKDFATFTDRWGWVDEKAEPMAMNLFMIDAVRWRPLRTRLTPMFTSGKLKEMFHLLLNCSDHFENHLNEIIPKDGIVECRNLTTKFTVDVIGSCAFGLEMNALKDENSQFHKMSRRILRLTLKTQIRSILREMPWVYKQIGHLFDDHDVIKFMIDITRDVMDYRKQNNVRRHDFIDTLIDLKDNPDKLGINVTDELIAAQTYTFFVAGYETSSTAMSCALYELAQNQSVQDKVRQEIKEVLNSTGGTLLYDSIKKMNYLDKIFQEALRKHPPLMYLTRRPVTNYTFEGTKVNLRKDQQVVIPIYAIQNDPNIYPNPEVFDPERFNVENIEKKNSMYHLPFGDGPRNCIAARFGMCQSKIGLIKVIMNYKIDVCEKTRIPMVHSPLTPFLLHSIDGIYVKLIKLP